MLRSFTGLISSLIWADLSEEVPSNMRKRRRSRSSCACAKYHPGSFIHSVVSSDSVRGQCICSKTRFRMTRPIYLF